MIKAKAFLLLALTAAPAAAAHAASSGPDLEKARLESGLTPMAPARLPAGFVFKDFDVLAYHGRKIIHLRYSNGAQLLSFFQCPPRLRLDFGGKERQKVRVAGGKGYFSAAAEGNVLGWSVKGARLVLIGPLTIDQLKLIAESVN